MTTTRTNFSPTHTALMKRTRERERDRENELDLPAQYIDVVSLFFMRSEYSPSCVVGGFRLRRTSKQDL